MARKTTDPELINLTRGWALDPERFIIEALKLPEKSHLGRVTSQQKLALRDIRNLVWCKIKRNEGTATKREIEIAKKIGVSIQSGQGTGKDAFAVWVMLWFLMCFPRSLIFATAPTKTVLKDILWREINKWLKDSLIEDLLVLQSDKLYMKERDGKDWFAIARTANPKDSPDEQAETLAGRHEDFMMYIIDEASKVPEPVFRPIEGSMTGKCNLALLIFNPTRSTGYAIRTQNEDRQYWICRHWDAEQSELTNEDSIKRAAQKYGRNSNFFRIRIKGLPPKEDISSFIHWEWVNECVEDYRREREAELMPDKNDRIIMGVDVASGRGEDKHAVAIRQGPCISIFDIPYCDTEEFSAWLLGLIADEDPDIICVCAIGVGYGVVDKLRRRCDKEIVEVIVSNTATDPRYYSLRDELWGRVRDKFEKRAYQIPNDDELIAQLTTVRKDIDFEEKTGKIKIESKKQMRLRHVMSPHKADALCLTELFEDEELKIIKKERHGWRRKLLDWTMI